MNGATFKKPLSHLSLIIQECWPLLNVWGIIHFDNFGYTHLDHAKSAIHRCLLLPFSFHSFDLRTLHALQLSCSNIAQLPKACKRKTRDLPQPLSQLGTVLQSAFAWLKLSRNQLHFVLLFWGQACCSIASCRTRDLYTAGADFGETLCIDAVQVDGSQQARELFGAIRIVRAIRSDVVQKQR